MRLPVLFFVEAVISFGSSLLTVGIYFYTSERFGWGLRENFMLAASQGLIYILGALLANRGAKLWGRRPFLIATYLVLALLLQPAAIWTRPAVLAIVLVAYMFVISMAWPVIESLVASGADHHEMNRRLGAYNLLWAGTGAVAVAVNGTIIRYFPAGVLLIPLLLHAICAGLLWFARVPGEDQPEAQADDAADRPEEQLLRRRRLALWLSRVALPATYVVIYSLSAMLPSLPAIKRLAITQATLVGSIWLATRWAAFTALGATAWWHTRPRVLLWSAFVMAGGFLGTVVSASAGSAGLALPLLGAVVFQAILGLALGMIYTASLYFGMVLSEGSTAHGGYHEALIGLGQALGAGAGAAAQWLFPGSTAAATVGVSVVIGLTLVGAVAVSVRARRS